MGRGDGVRWTIALLGLAGLCAAAGCDDEEETGTPDAGGGDTAGETGGDTAGDTTNDQPAGDTLDGEWILPLEGACGLLLEQDGTTVTGTVYGDSDGEEYPIEDGALAGTSLTLGYTLGPDTVDLALTVRNDHWLTGTFTRGDTTVDVAAIRTEAGVLAACNSGTPFGQGVAGGWVGLDLDGFCGFTLAEDGMQISGTAYGDGESESYAATGTRTGSDLALEYSLGDEGVVTMDLTLRESGILLEGTATATGEEPIEVGFGRVTEEAIEACPSL